MRVKVKEAEAEASNWKEERDIQAKESVLLLKKIAALEHTVATLHALHAPVVEEAATKEEGVSGKDEGVSRKTEEEEEGKAPPLHAAAPATAPEESTQVTSPSEQFFLLLYFSQAWS